MSRESPTPAAGRALRAPLLVAAVAVAVYLWPAVTEMLEYDRSRIASGEVWRLLTGHWAHWSFDHLLLDGLVVAAVGVTYALRGGRRFAGCILAAALAVSAAVWTAAPHIVRYRGLSGVAAAVTVLLAAHMLRVDVPRRGWLGAVPPAVAVGGLLLKVGFEVANGHAAFVDSVAAGFVPVPIAHVVGAAVGVVVALLPAQKPRVACTRTSWYGSAPTAQVHGSEDGRARRGDLLHRGLGECAGSSVRRRPQSA